MGSGISPQSSLLLKYQQDLVTTNILWDSPEAYFGVTKGQRMFKTAYTYAFRRGKTSLM